MFPFFRLKVAVLFIFCLQGTYDSFINLHNKAYLRLLKEEKLRTEIKNRKLHIKTKKDVKEVEPAEKEKEKETEKKSVRPIQFVEAGDGILINNLFLYDI